MPELDDTDKAILAELLRETIERDRFPLSPRMRSLKVILAKLDPPAATGAIAAAKAAGRAQHGTGEKAAQIKQGLGERRESL